MQEKYWGYHLILDCRACDKEVITSKEKLRDFIKGLVIAIDMKAFGEPIIEHFASHSEKTAGFSLVQLIETSAITGHLVDASGDVYLDIFSCKPFSVDTAKELIQKTLQPSSMKTVYLTRQA